MNQIEALAVALHTIGKGLTIDDAPIELGDDCTLEVELHLVRKGEDIGSMRSGGKGAVFHGSAKRLLPRVMAMAAER